MTEPADYDDILTALPLRYRLCRALDRRGWLPGLQAFLTGNARERDAGDWEWRGEIMPDGKTFEITFAAPRILTRLRMLFENPPEQRTAVISTWDGSDWHEERVDTEWSVPEGDVQLLVHFRRLVVTPRLSIRIEGYSEGGANVAPRVARYSYWDAEHLAGARDAFDREHYTAAERQLRACLELSPSHFTAAYGMGKLFEAQKKWPEVRHWGMMAYAHSHGASGADLLHKSCEQQASNLPAEVPDLKQQAADWDVGGHHGAVCLQYERRYWLGFERLHLAQTRQVIEIRRQAAARLLRQLHLDYRGDNERLVFARLRILRGDGQISEVPIEQLAVMDDPEQNPAIRTQHRRTALFHLPEVNRGDCLELEYTVVHSHPLGPNERPDIFILSDLNCDFPTRRSIARIHCPHDWNLRCIGINGAPEPSVSDDGEDGKTFVCEAEQLYYDEWGTIELERFYRSPFLCCAWEGTSWRDVGEHALTHGCHAPREDTLPDVLQAAMESGDTAVEKLRAGFEWVRDRLKYLSLHSAKERSNTPDLAKQIVAAGVADCMDKAYLLLQICRQLGIESEYLLASLENGFIVPETPAPQFDHILLRAKLDGEWVYLDATSTQTPFGWIPPQLQGMHVLPLEPPFELVTVPEESPDKNFVSIEETLICGEDGTVGGDFALEAGGFPARWWDEQWKGASMTSPDPHRAASLGLRQQLPSATLQKDWKNRQYEQDTQTCGFSGRHTRRNLLPIDGGQVGFADWHTPLFPVYRNLERSWTGLTVFPIPMTYSITCRVKCPDGWSISGSSLARRVETDFGTVHTEVRGHRGGIDTKIHLVVERRFVDAAHADKIPDFLSAWDDALRFAFILRP